MMNKNNGFTLIELMLVVSIIGILAAIAFPSYQNYTIRAKVSEALVLADPVKKAISEFYDRWGTFPENNKQAGLPSPNALTGNYVQNITVDHGVVEITLQKLGNTVLEGKKMRLRPAINTSYTTGSVAWICDKGDPPKGTTPVGVVLPADVSLNNNYLPSLCRGSK
jgi:type IV pilus assembly protein PilA